MTREKEITKEAKKFAKEIDDWEIAEDVQDAFEQGARWAERTMIAKACEWLEETFKDGEVIAPLLLVQLIDKFRKAMKGE